MFGGMWSILDLHCRDSSLCELFSSNTCLDLFKGTGKCFYVLLKSSCTQCIRCVCFVSTAMWEVSRQDLLITGHSTFSAILQSFPWNIIIHSACCFFVTYNRAYVIHMCARTHTQRKVFLHRVYSCWEKESYIPPPLWCSDASDNPNQCL